MEFPHREKAGRDREVLEYIAAATEHLEETKPEQWYTAPVLNAMFSAYFKKAQQNNIQVEAHLSFPEKLPVDEAGLSLVLANALENAIHACKQLPEEQRRIVCRAIHYPRLMIEVVNSCNAPVALDQDGFPTSAQEGHGVGMQSIRSFCQWYRATCSCRYRQGQFCLQIAF